MTSVALRPRRPGARLVSVGTALPEGTITNADLEQMIDTDDEWIRSRTGIVSRHTGSTTTELATVAAQVAIERAEVDPSCVDMVIVATQTPDMACPSTAAGVQATLGVQCGAFDLNAACAGFAYGVACADGLIGSGLDTVVVVGVDRMTAATDYDDRSTAPLFGDGAGAVVVRSNADRHRGLLAWDAGTDGTRPDILQLPLGGTVSMNGQEVFKHMVRYAEETARRALAEAQVELDDVAYVFAHQANQRILDAVEARLGAREGTFVSVISHTGNTSAASVPLALDRAVGDGRVEPDDLIMLMGFGGGLSWATAVTTWA